MNDNDLLQTINDVLKTVTSKDVNVTRETDLIEEGVIDSLDSMLFLLELEKLTGQSFPQEGDLVEQGFFRVGELMKFIQSHESN